MGAVIGHALGNPVLAFIMGFMAHLIIDMVPHGDTGISDNFRVHKKRRKQAVAYVAIDAVIAICFVLLLFNTKDILSIQNFTWGIVGSILPDFLVGVYEIKKTKYLHWFYKVHFYFHDYFVKKKGDVPLKYAIVGQMIFIAYLQTKI